MITRESLDGEIKDFVTEYDKRSSLQHKWRAPLTGVADAAHPGFERLKELVHPDHDLPRRILPDASTVVAYFIPFSEAVVRSNRDRGLASPEWARVYEETNAMLTDLSGHMCSFLKARGYRGAVSGEASVFDREKILSKWSQRHIAYLAGLGSFGLNNMLITTAGCCGRFSTIVTNLDLTPDVPLREDYCLHKRNGTCGVCVRRCPAGALRVDRFDRQLCYGRCLENAKVYTQFGSSYASVPGGAVAASGSEVCGKCLIGLPCSMTKPE